MSSASATTHPRLPGHLWLPEPQLAFHPERLQDRSPHPLRGLHQFGPFSRATINTVVDPIRVAAISPAGELSAIDKIVAELAQSHQPRERRVYLPGFPGFERVFGIRVTQAVPAARVELPSSLDADLANSGTAAHIALAERLTQALNRLAAVRHEFDVVLIYLPDRWRQGFFGGEGDDFDLHAHVKAAAARLGIPSQVLREDRVMQYACRCSVAWRLGIALYAKAGGTPWRLADIEPDTAFVGLGYRLRVGVDGRTKFVTCCSQVFDADGTGFEFLVYTTQDFRAEGDNPFLSRNEMARVMARSLELYRRRHAGRIPRRAVIHKTSEFKREEIDGCFDALRACSVVDLIQVQQDTIWRGVQLEAQRTGGKKGGASAYPVLRGTCLPLSGREILLWTQGNAPSAVGGRNFYKEGKGIPAPILLRRFAGHGGWDETCRFVLALSKMNWNSDSLYDRLPVTIEYAQTLADIARRMDGLSSTPYEFRLFM